VRGAAFVTLGAFIALAALSLGCSSQIGLGRARTLDRGKYRVGFSTETDFLTPNAWEESGATLPWVQMGLGYHRGITDHVELGGRVWGFTVPTVFTTWGAAADGKVALLRPEPGRGRLNIATGLSLGYHQPRYGGNPYHVFHGTLPVLFGYAVARHQLVFGPRIADYVITAYGMNTVNSFYFGGSLGFAIRIKETFDLFPEVVAMWSPISLNGETEDSSRVGVGMLQLGLGFNWDL
jgi:hypothetical protein